ncbi:YfiT family bacillithiol transferase [Staphylococcus felis]|uniref:Putative metal-dependent hydrolase n=1 Tax=Staphylococcus felis TaxID=46127 RepID=A0A3E0IPF3_9STAP|nr:putative metal-dependent hydrolase [Staphylococcus felis]REH84461.1 putative metal-dependent hydrolase [Staphylococcus felis]REH87420.1 putative metal-dependent hydrolase [Staphylococcus felis]REH94976.1 putative metal-dependent hydrolase [Staphylococcus felis]REI11910.1 putative metal-dependent hydrolase [Staphylococcus felis]
MDVRFPIGQLEVPESISLDDIQTWLEDIDGFTVRLSETVTALDDTDLEKTYREGAWTVRQLVHHIADSQLNMYQRLKLALTNDGVSLPEFDQNHWAQLPDNQAPIHVSLDLIKSLNARIVVLGRGLQSHQLQNQFLLEGKEAVSVGETIAKLSWHANHHHAHIKVALGEMIQ